MYKAERYSYRVTWSEDDQEYVGLVDEFPSMSWLAESQIDALTGIRDRVGEALVDLADPPEPLSQREYSGKLHSGYPSNVDESEVSRVRSEMLNSFVGVCYECGKSTSSQSIEIATYRGGAMVDAVTEFCGDECFRGWYEFHRSI